MDDQVVGGDTGITTQTLICDLKGLLSDLPITIEELALRASNARKIIGELYSVGIDAENLIRYAMRQDVRFPILVALLGDLGENAIEADAWKDALGVASVDKEDAAFPAKMADVLGSLDAWAMLAPLKELLSLAPPLSEDLRSYRLEHRRYSEVERNYVWLYARMVHENLEAWDTESLHFEYRWQNQLERAPFPGPVLASTGPEGTMLRDQIAHRAATGIDENESSADALFWQLQDAAISFLSKGKFAEAAALFEFHCGKEPNDPRGFNNLGFCYLPTDPGRALPLLEQANRAGYGSKLVNIYNQCCALIALNRLPEAVDRAEYFWQRDYRSYDGTSGFVWHRAEKLWVLVSDPAIDRSLAQLLADASRQLGLADRESVWLDRASVENEGA